MMEFTPIDLRAWPRGELFYYYSRMAPTGYSISVETDVTALLRTLRAAGLKFFPAYIWAVTKNLNAQTEFKVAEKDGTVGFYDTLTPLYAAFHEDTHTFSLMWTEFDGRFSDFHAAYIQNAQKYGGNHGILSRPGETPPPNSYVVSCVPWISFTGFSVHSYENKPYYFPSVEAGRFFARDGKTLMPLSLTCHHAATDGYHIDVFLKALQADFDSFERYI